MPVRSSCDNVTLAADQQPANAGCVPFGSSRPGQRGRVSRQPFRPLGPPASAASVSSPHAARRARGLGDDRRGTPDAATPHEWIQTRRRPMDAAPRPTSPPASAPPGVRCGAEQITFASSGRRQATRPDPLSTAESTRTVTGRSLVTVTPPDGAGPDRGPVASLATNERFASIPVWGASCRTGPRRRGGPRWRGRGRTAGRGRLRRRRW